MEFSYNDNKDNAQFVSLNDTDNFQEYWKQ